MRVSQPRRLGEGPGAALYIVRDAEARGTAAAGRRHRRGHRRQHRHRTRRWSPTRCGYRTVIVMPETQSQEKKDMLRLCRAELRLVPAVPYQDPGNYVRVSERLAAELAQQRAARRDLGEPVRQPRQPARATTRRPGRRSGSRPTARSTPSSRRSAPAARSPASAWRSKERKPNVRIVLADPARLGAVPLLRARRAEGRGRSRSPRASARAASPRISRARRSTARCRSPTRRRCRSSSTCSAEEGPGASAARPASTSPARSAVARQLGPGHTVVTVLCDYGTRYQSKLFNPEFLRARTADAGWLE